MNITKTKNGFIFNSTEYIFSSENDIISESQVLVGTTDGIIMLDLSCTIDGVHYEDINEFIKSIF